ncbi:DUF4912 domain-containing protein [Paenibacillus sp. GCM10027629]|uniref:DUF4912 domain-containing protein n=1 Tax=Paenibacillus sp. GCM10027629 TaxID=3273414 RepID=UPI003641EDFD
MSESEHAPILPAYHHNVLQLMVVSPTTLYAYWEISERTITAVTRHYHTDWASMPKIIRLYENNGSLSSISHDAAKYTDHSVEDARSWYFHDLTPARSYTADFGTYNIYHQFVPLLRGNTVRTPRNRAATIEQGHPLSEHMHEQHPSLNQGATLENTSPYHEFSTYSVYHFKEGVHT